jgi:hypothetical protein
MGKWLRRVGLALLCSLLAGFALGTCLRRELERPTLYIGDLGEPGGRSSSAHLWTPVHAGAP